jgi:anti-anti-sigma factor
MEIQVSTEKARVPVSVVRVTGNIDSATYESFQAKMESLIQGGTRHMLIDLTGVAYVSSAGLRALNSTFISLRRLTPDVSDDKMREGINAGTYKSPHLKLLNPSQPTKVALETSGFDMFIQTFTDLKLALASY